MGLPRFARKDEWRFCGHCEECGDEAISISLTFAIGSTETKKLGNILNENYF
jgi:hypothetical protein